MSKITPRVRALAAIALLTFAAGAAYAACNPTLANLCKAKYVDCLKNNGSDCEQKYIACMKAAGCTPML